MRACPPSTFLCEQRKGQRSFLSVHLSLAVPLPFWSSLSSYVGLVPYYSGSIARSLMFPVGNTVHRRHQRVTFLRVGFCLGHLFHPAFLIDDQSLQEGCVINRSPDWLRIASNVRRSVVSIFLCKMPLLVPWLLRPVLRIRVAPFFLGM